MKRIHLPQLEQKLYKAVAIWQAERGEKNVQFWFLLSCKPTEPLLHTHAYVGECTFHQCSWQSSYHTVKPQTPCFPGSPLSRSTVRPKCGPASNGGGRLGYREMHTQYHKSTQKEPDTKTHPRLLIDSLLNRSVYHTAWMMKICMYQTMGNVSLWLLTSSYGKQCLQVSLIHRYEKVQGFFRAVLQHKAFLSFEGMSSNKRECAFSLEPCPHYQSSRE